MAENIRDLQKYSMQFGTYMGGYWILKFILFPLGFRIPFFSLVFLILTFAVPFIGYRYLKSYRDQICNGAIRFSHAVLFTLFMYIFASLLVAMAHYIYFQFIDHGFVIDAYTQLWNELLNQDLNTEENRKIINELIETLQSLSPIQITMQILSWDFFWGAILSIPTALVGMKRAKASPTTNN